MANVLGNTSDDLEITALGASRGEEVPWLKKICEVKGRLVDEMAYENGNLIRRAVDGARYDQYYPEVNEENIRFLLALISDFRLRVKSCSEDLFIILNDVFSNGTDCDREKFVTSIEQIRLFDARGKDVSSDKVNYHPLKIDIKFRAEETDALRRRILSFRSNENGDEKMKGVIDLFLRESESVRGHIERYFIGYEWGIPGFMGFDINDVPLLDEEGRKKFFENYSVKLDVRYDAVETLNGQRLTLVTREVEINNGNDQIPHVLKQMKAEGYVPFLPAEMGFGKLVRMNHPEEAVAEVIKKRKWAYRIDEMLEKMKAQYRSLQENIGKGQIVVHLEDKADHLKRLTSRKVV